MTTVLQYLVIAAVIGLLLFGIALVVFGRGERLSALPARTSPAQLPEQGIHGADVRRVRFALAVRGYRMSDVDWTLDRLADELDRTREQLALVTGGDLTSAANTTPQASPAEPAPAKAPSVGSPTPAGAAQEYPQHQGDPDPGTRTNSAASPDGLRAAAPESTSHDHDVPDTSPGSLRPGRANRPEYEA